MQQTQNDQQVSYSQNGQERNGRQSIQFGKRQRANPVYHSFSEEVEDDAYEIPEEQHNKERQPNYKLLTGEQKCVIADQHEHPFENENSPWRRQQAPAIIKRENT